MSPSPSPVAAPGLSWAREDLEQRLFFRGAPHTRVNTLFSMLLGGILAVGFYAALMPLDGRFAEMFTRRGAVPYVIVFFSCWSLAIVFVKWRKLALQRRALRQEIIPARSSFFITAENVGDVIDGMYQVVDEPKHFVLFNRIVIALSNLRNLGRISDVDDILRTQAAADESSMNTTYSLLRGFTWAIPVMGFIGTVLGLSEAIGGFGAVLQESGELSQIKVALQGVTGGLATAFETTLEALVAALVIQILVTFLMKSEEEFLDQCTDYCLRKIVNRLRMVDPSQLDAFMAPPPEASAPSPQGVGPAASPQGVGPQT